MAILAVEKKVAYRRQKKMKLNHKGPRQSKICARRENFRGGTSGQLEEFFPII
jgi:hypothetical protein